MMERLGDYSEEYVVTMIKVAGAYLVSIFCIQCSLAWYEYLHSYVHIYICTYVCMYVYMYLCIHVYRYICIYVCMCLPSYLPVYLMSSYLYIQYICATHMYIYILSEPSYFCPAPFRWPALGQQPRTCLITQKTEGHII